MYCASNLDDLKSFLDEAKQGFVVERIHLEHMPDWSFCDGALSHRSGGFFSVVGTRFGNDPARERVLLYQPQSAITGLLTTTHNNERYFLLQARAEPGTFGLAQYGPTIQSTPANYLRLHGGNTSPYVEWFTTFKSAAQVLHDSMQLDLGERYLFKSKRLIVTQAPHDLTIAPGYIWVPASLISRSTEESTFLNLDLRSLLNVCQWTQHGRAQLSPASDIVSSGLALRPRSDLLLGLLDGIKAQSQAYRFLDIHQLDAWTVESTGIIDTQNQQGFNVRYYSVEARGREVRAWSQPLVDSQTNGLALLCCRIHHEHLQFLIRIGSEHGLQTGQALLPSVLIYPGSQCSHERPVGRTLRRTTESDEGGRFFRDTSTYELILMDAPPDQPEPGTVWLGVSELMLLLQFSNLCSIQLRGLASLLLGRLDL